MKKKSHPRAGCPLGYVIVYNDNNELATDEVYSTIKDAQTDAENMINCGQLEPDDEIVICELEPVSYSAPRAKIEWETLP